MNTALQTLETSPDPIHVKPRAKKATNELKTKSKCTIAKKRVLANAKNPTPKRKTTKAESNPKAASRKMKPSIIKDNRPEPIAMATQPIFTTPELPVYSDLPSQEVPVISEPAVEQTAFSTADEAFDPLSCDDQIGTESIFAAGSIPAPGLLEPVVADSIPDLKLETLNGPNSPAETVALFETEAITPEAPTLDAAKETPPTPLARFWKSMASQLIELWNWAQEKFRSHQVRKRLRVCETVSLGEKRFLAVVQVDGEQFLVGGSSSSVSTLAHLERSRDFSDVFQRHCEQDLSRA